MSDIVERLRYHANLNQLAPSWSKVTNEGAYVIEKLRREIKQLGEADKRLHNSIRELTKLLDSLDWEDEEGNGTFQPELDNVKQWLERVAGDAK